MLHWRDRHLCSAYMTSLTHHRSSVWTREIDRPDRDLLGTGAIQAEASALMSSSGVPVEEIARLACHSNTRTTEVVYRRELHPVLTTGAEAMDRLSQAPRSLCAVHRGSARNLATKRHSRPIATERITADRYQIGNSIVVESGSAEPGGQCCRSDGCLALSTIAL